MLTDGGHFFCVALQQNCRQQTAVSHKQTRVLRSKRACGAQNKRVLHFHTGVWRAKQVGGVQNGRMTFAMGACGMNTNQISSGLNSIAIAMFAMFSLNASLCRNCFVATAENFAKCEGSDYY